MGKWQYNMILISLQVLLYTIVGFGAKIVALPFPNGVSHFFAMAKIGAELEARGHEV